MPQAKMLIACVYTYYQHVPAALIPEPCFVFIWSFICVFLVFTVHCVYKDYILLYGKDMYVR